MAKGRYQAYILRAPIHRLAGWMGRLWHKESAYYTHHHMGGAPVQAAVFQILCISSACAEQS